MPFTLPPLPYPTNALEPHIDAKTMEIHHGKHHQAYVTNLNAALEKAPELANQPLETLLAGVNKAPEAVRMAIRNNGGGHWNHSLFWSSWVRAPGVLPAGRWAMRSRRPLGTSRSSRNSSAPLASAASGQAGSG